MMQLSSLRPAKGSVKKPRECCRGGKRGTFSGRGCKGQRARSGGSSGLKAMGMKAMIARMPKNRGFHSQYPKMAVVNVSLLQANFQDGDVVNSRRLIQLGAITHAKNGVKILGVGELTKKLTVEADSFSVSAKEAIEKAGGKVVIRAEKSATVAK